MLQGSNCIVFDCETKFSASDCRHCGAALEQHYADGACSPWEGDRPGDDVTQWSALGWNDKAALGLSIGAAFDYQTQCMVFFDSHTLQQTMTDWVARQALMVSFNGITFDGPLLRSILRRHAEALRLNEPELFSSVDEAAEQSQRLVGLCDAFKSLMLRGYDILQALWTADYASKMVKGLNTLDAIAQANGMPPKASGGALIPQWWREGRYADVLEYVVDDVHKTRMLFQQVMRGEPLARQDGSQVLLHRPALSRNGLSVP